MPRSIPLNLIVSGGTEALVTLHNSREYLSVSGVPETVQYPLCTAVHGSPCLLISIQGFSPHTGNPDLCQPTMSRIKASMKFLTEDTVLYIDAFPG